LQAQNAMPEREEAEPQSVALIAGNGQFPFYFADGARSAGVRVVALALKGETDPSLEEHVDALHWVGIAQIGRWIKLCHKEGVHHAAMCGGVTKGKMYDPRRILNYAPDARALSLWFKKAPSKKDHALLELLASELAAEGIELVSSVHYCRHILSEAGCLTRSRPSKSEARDVDFGWPIAKEVARLQIGQTIVVKEECVIAVEGVEGTDEVLRRGGALGRGKVVGIKVAKHDHDERFDIPTIGPGTSRTLKEAGVRVMAIEAGKTIVLDREETVRLADDAGVCIIARE